MNPNSQAVVRAGRAAAVLGILILGQALALPGSHAGVPGNGTPGNGSPANGSPPNGTPGNGAPGNGSPGNGMPNGVPNGTPNGLSNGLSAGLVQGSLLLGNLAIHKTLIDNPLNQATLDTIKPIRQALCNDYDRLLLGYLFNIAMPAGTSVQVDVDCFVPKPRLTLFGVVGAAPGWATGPLSTDEQERLSAAFAALINSRGVHNYISVRGSEPGSLSSMATQVGSWYYGHLSDAPVASVAAACPTGDVAGPATDCGWQPGVIVAADRGHTRISVGKNPSGRPIVMRICREIEACDAAAALAYAEPPPGDSAPVVDLTGATGMHNFLWRPKAIDDLPAFAGANFPDFSITKVAPSGPASTNELDVFPNKEAAFWGNLFTPENFNPKLRDCELRPIDCSNLDRQDPPRDCDCGPNESPLCACARSAGLIPGCPGETPTDFPVESCVTSIAPECVRCDRTLAAGDLIFPNIRMCIAPHWNGPDQGAGYFAARSCSGSQGSCLGRFLGQCEASDSQPYSICAVTSHTTDAGGTNRPLHDYDQCAAAPAAAPAVAPATRESAAAPAIPAEAGGTSVVTSFLSGWCDVVGTGTICTEPPPPEPAIVIVNPQVDLAIFNNRDTATIDNPDIVIRRAHSPQGISALRFDITVRNLGTKEAADVLVRTVDRIKGLRPILLDERVIRLIPAHGARTFSFRWNPRTLGPGPRPTVHEFRVTLDPNNTIPERSESNNSAVQIERVRGNDLIH